MLSSTLSHLFGESQRQQPFHEHLLYPTLGHHRSSVSACCTELPVRYQATPRGPSSGTGIPSVFSHPFLQQRDRAGEQHHRPVALPASEDDDLMHQAMHMWRSIALLSQSVRKLAEAPSAAPSSPTKGRGTVSMKANARQTAWADAIKTVACGNGGANARMSETLQVIPSPPISTLCRTIRKKRTKPFYRCCECGSSSTTQWRNTPAGEKICNRCGMRMWRNRKKECAETGKSSANNEHQASLKAAGERVEGRYVHRSNIYALLN